MVRLTELNNTENLFGPRRISSPGHGHQVAWFLGKHTEAHDLLRPDYHWFAEGFDTKDLKEAKALLDEFES